MPSKYSYIYRLAQFLSLIIIAGSWYYREPQLCLVQTIIDRGMPTTNGTSITLSLRRDRKSVKARGLGGLLWILFSGLDRDDVPIKPYEVTLAEEGSSCRGRKCHCFAGTRTLIDAQGQVVSPIPRYIWATLIGLSRFIYKCKIVVIIEEDFSEL